MPKISTYDELTEPTSDDLLYIINAPGTTPVSKKVTVANLFASQSVPLSFLPSLADPIGTDILYIVDDPAGGAIGKKLTITNLFANVPLDLVIGKDASDSSSLTLNSDAANECNLFFKSGGVNTFCITRPPGTSDLGLWEASVGYQFYMKPGGRIGLGVANTTPEARLDIRQLDAAGAISPLMLLQTDQDFPVIDIRGTSAADQTKNISTANGDGAVTGPKNYSTTAGWEFDEMVLAMVNNVRRWIPCYIPDTA